MGNYPSGKGFGKMEVEDAIRERRSLRGFERFEVTDYILNSLKEAARLSPSCFNNQPWRYVFVTGEKKLKDIHEALTGGNYWAKNASIMVAVSSRKDLDCMIKGRNYYNFDCGLSASLLILRAWDLGLVAHPMAGYSPSKAKEILKIPDDQEVITLIAIGKHSNNWKEILNEKQWDHEENRPDRKKDSEIFFTDEYSG
mgnify:CR=1 FL=1